MADTPQDLLRSIDGRLRALGAVASLILEGQRTPAARSPSLPEVPRADGRDERGRFLPGSGGGGGSTQRRSLSHVAGITESAVGLLPPLPPLQAAVHKGASVLRLIDQINALRGHRGGKKRRTYAPRFKKPSFTRQMAQAWQDDARAFQRQQLFRSKNKFLSSPPPSPPPTPAPKASPPRPPVPPTPAAKPTPPPTPPVRPAPPSPVPAHRAPSVPQSSPRLSLRKITVARRQADEALRRSLQKMPALPAFVERSDLTRTPDQAAKLARDRAIAAGKSPGDVQGIGQRAFDYAHEHTTNRGAIYQRELLRAQKEGLGAEESMRRARERVGNAVRHIETPKMSAPMQEDAGLSLKGAKASTGGLPLTNSIEELTASMEELKGAIKELASNVTDLQGETATGTGSGKSAFRGVAHTASNVAKGGNKAGEGINRELGHVLVEGAKAIGTALIA